jgi:transposase
MNRSGEDSPCGRGRDRLARCQTVARTTVLGGPGFSSNVNPRDRELLTGMGNCYEACHEDFEHTIEMVAGNRHRTPGDVMENLRQMREQFATDPEYQRLRGRFPADFPV